MGGKMSTVSGSFKITKDQHEKLKKMSELTGVSQATIVRKALDDFFKKNEDILTDQRTLFK
ncbi:MAG: ribbon-helix-helix domain-containing protein [bacterium]|nr:ribbon-helix-helix domain-containing protein [bacterium]